MRWRCGEVDDPGQLHPEIYVQTGTRNMFIPISRAWLDGVTGTHQDPVFGLLVHARAPSASQYASASTERPCAVGPFVNVSLCWESSNHARRWAAVSIAW